MFSGFARPSSCGKCTDARAWNELIHPAPNDKHLKNDTEKIWISRRHRHRHHTKVNQDQMTARNRPVDSAGAVEHRQLH